MTSVNAIATPRAAVRHLIHAAACAVACVLTLAASPTRATGAAVAEPSIPDPVARVNGQPVTRAEWQRTMVDARTRTLYQRERDAQATQEAMDTKAYSHWVLKKLVVKHLTLQEAARRKLAIPDAELEKAVEAWKAGYKGGPKAAQKAMRARNMSESALRETLRNDMLIARVTSEVLKDVKLSERQVRAYYERHKAEFQAPEEALLKVIAVKDKETADNLVASLRGGEPFDTLARQVSTSPRATQLSEGKWVPVNAMPPVLREPVAALKPGENTAALQGGAEYFVVRLEDRRPARAQTFVEVRPQIEKRLLPEAQKEALHAWLRKLERKAKVEILVS